VVDRGYRKERDKEPHIDYGSDPEPTLVPDSRLDIPCSTLWRDANILQTNEF